MDPFEISSAIEFNQLMEPIFSYNRLNEQNFGIYNY